MVSHQRDRQLLDLMSLNQNLLLCSPLFHLKQKLVRNQSRIKRSKPMKMLVSLMSRCNCESVRANPHASVKYIIQYPKTTYEPKRPKFAEISAMLQLRKCLQPPSDRPLIRIRISILLISYTPLSTFGARRTPSEYIAPLALELRLPTSASELAYREQ